MNTSLFFSLLGVAIVSLTFFLFAFGYHIQRESNTTNIKIAQDVVKDVIEQSSLDSRHRWVDNETIEFIYLILGPGDSSCSHFVWARIRITRNAMKAQIEYSHDAGRHNIYFAHTIARCMIEAKIEASVLRHSSDQPNLTETGVKTFNGDTFAR